MNTTSFEVEVKISISNTESTESALHALGAEKTNAEIQTDIYFDHPCRSFADTDEAVRIRSSNNITEFSESSNTTSPKMEITYKGPKVDKTTKTRLELSIGIDDVENAGAILKELGFRNVATIRKSRYFYLYQKTIISIDNVEHVGLFLEFERVVDSEELIPSARQEIFKQIEKLGLNPSDSIRESYLELYLRKEHS